MALIHAVAVLGLLIVPWSLAGAQARGVVLPYVHADTGHTPGLVTVTGVVFDSVSHTPLRDALVQMQPRTDSGTTVVYSARTDSTGHYRIEDVPRGIYLGTFFHPALVSLGLQARIWRVDATDSLTRVMYAVPSPSTIWAGWCGQTNLNDSTGLLLGRIHDADTGSPLAGSIVTVTWSELVLDQRRLQREQRELTAETDQYGLFRVCGVPARWAAVVHAARGAASSGSIEVQAPYHGLLQRDIGIGGVASAVVATADSARAAAPSDRSAEPQRGTARLDGTVRSATGEPMRDVQLLIRDGTARDNSDANGHFALSGLPAGTYTLEARHIGFTPARVVVDLASHRLTTVAVTLDKRAAVLNEVTVYGKRSRARSTSGFAERRKLGFGHSFTRADIERRHPLVLSDLFRGGAAGIQVVPTDRGFGHKLIVRGGSTSLMPEGGCEPAIYLDGMLLTGEGDGDVDWFANPHDVTGVEVYSGPEQTPPQYPGSGCGSVLIWTTFHVRD